MKKVQPTTSYIGNTQPPPPRRGRKKLPPGQQRTRIGARIHPGTKDVLDSLNGGADLGVTLDCFIQEAAKDPRLIKRIKKSVIRQIKDRELAAK